ncbi:hypothetical protein FHX82_002927 [Amycolatopsis bartoniae]|uniref:DUF5130 family protein n=1 Tax=Amycolatopsis bartoniae TaxID=941986 RepID=A0A8H9J1X4_9PSEU|nr:DUF5130 family protein [Amycolatopsis bartoniae]MBB2935873.1 hypothetical protein [Amycolatopsis bartoniae]TVT05008.1 DUF5130 family protein [Amycolatopsis bartoniae]GHF62479.1 hypothetical protein GCM10017566_40010 [Amycolatopsis bartoniae]
MAAGELVQQNESGEAEFGVGVTSTGRRSVARMYEPAKPSVPFTVPQLARLDEALTLASRETGIDFSVYLGDLGGDTRESAEKLHASIGETAARSVLIAVSPGERVVEVVTGAEAFPRLPDRAAKLAVMSMVASFKEGDLIGGLVSGLRMLADQAGHAPA